MKLTGDTAILDGAAAFAARYAAAAGSAFPALAGVRIQAGDERLLLRAYDQEAAGSVELPLAADEPGELVVPAKLFADILHALPAGPVQLFEERGALQVACGADDGEIRFALPTLPTEDQPEPPSAPGGGTVSAEAFLQAARRTGRIAARDEVVPIFTGTSVRFGPERLILAASDRYRVGICDLPWSGHDDEDTTVAVPAKVLADTASGLSPVGELELGVRAEGGGSVFGVRSAADGQVRSAVLRLLDGPIPPFTSKVPENFLGTATVDAHELRAALRRICLVAERYAAVVLTVADSRLTVRASGQAAALGRQTLAVQAEGQGTTTAYNASYLLDGLDFVGGDTVRLAYNEGMRAASLITSHDAPGYRYVVMPRRLPEAGDAPS